jgi:hypothetical protein
MLNRKNAFLATLTVALLVVLMMMVNTTLARSSGNASTPRRVDILALGEDDVRQLLLLMDTNKNEKI